MLHFFIVLAVGAACWDASSFAATIIVGSIARVWYWNVSVIDYTRFMPFLSRIGRVSSGGACCIFWP